METLPFSCNKQLYYDLKCKKFCLMGLALYCSHSARRRGRTNYIHINAQLLKIMVHYNVRLMKIAKENRADHQ